jgi:hypothetical protein
MSRTTLKLHIGLHPRNKVSKSYKSLLNWMRSLLRCQLWNYTTSAKHHIIISCMWVKVRNRALRRSKLVPNSWLQFLRRSWIRWCNCHSHWRVWNLQYDLRSCRLYEILRYDSWRKSMRIAVNDQLCVVDKLLLRPRIHSTLCNNLGAQWIFYSIELHANLFEIL